MKRKLYVGVFFLGACALLLWWLSSKTVYYRRDFFGQIKGLWRTNESFAFLEIDTTVEKDSMRELFLAKHAGLYGPHSPHITRSLLTFHFKDGKLTEYKQPNFDLSGQLFPFRDAPALLRGGYERSAFTWENGKFVKMDELDLQKLRPTFSTNGWEKLDWEQVGNVGPGYDKTFALGNGVTVRLTMGFPTTNKEGYIVKNAPFTFDLSVPNHKPISISLSQQYNEIRKEKFETLFHAASAQSWPTEKMSSR